MDNFTPELKPVESKEGEPVHNIFTLSEKERQMLQARVLESKGLVRIMVHPYYIAQKKISEPEILRYYDLERVDIVEKGFEKMLNTNSTTPILLFEGHDMISGTIHKIKSLLEKSKKSIYVVPTYPASPRPYFPELDSGGQWDKIVELLKKLGVKKLIIGGMLLEVSVQEDYLKGCVGNLVEHLRDDFEIQVSSITSPQSRKDVKNPDIK